MGGLKYRNRVPRPADDITPEEQEQSRNANIEPILAALITTGRAFDSFTHAQESKTFTPVPWADSDPIIRDLRVQFREAFEYHLWLARQSWSPRDPTDTDNDGWESEVDSGPNSDSGEHLGSADDSGSDTDSWHVTSVSDFNSSSRSEDEDNDYIHVPEPNRNDDSDHGLHVEFGESEDDADSTSLNRGHEERTTLVAETFARLDQYIGAHGWSSTPKSYVPASEPRGILFNLIAATMFKSPEEFAENFTCKPSRTQSV